MKKEILSYIEKMLGDISPKTVEIYKEKFSTMSDSELKNFFKNNDIRLFVDDKLEQPMIDTLIKRTGYVAEEKIVYPEKNNAKSMKKMIVFPIQIRRLQQVATTESNSSINTDIRDKINQATRESRTSKLTDVEVSILAGIGMDACLTEMLSPRSDNQMGKNKMNEMLREKGTFKLADIPKTPNSRNSVLYLDALYKSMNMATDLVDEVEDIGVM